MASYKTIRAKIAAVLSNGWVQLFLILASAALAIPREVPTVRLFSLAVVILAIAVFWIGIRGLRRLARTEPEPTIREYLRPLRSTVVGLLILWLPIWVISATSCCAPITA
jgi:hypothetical protein